MASVNDTFLRREELKIKQNLERLASASTSTVCSNIYKKPSSITLSEAQHEKLCSPKTSPAASSIQCHPHLSHFFSFLQKPVRRSSNTERKKSKDYTPFSNVNSTTVINKPTLPPLQRLKGSTLRRNSGSLTRASSSQWLFPSQQTSSTSMLRALELYPSQHRFSRDSLTQESLFGNPAIKKKWNDLYLKACEEGNPESTINLPVLQPEEALRCRYLRLSDRNVVRLLQMCKDKGINVDIHPHMKESDIDINTVFQNMNTVDVDRNLF